MSEYSEVIPRELGHYVYRLWAADGTCLYIGCTGERSPRSLPRRFVEHKRDKSWWPDVVRKDVRSFPSPAGLPAEERAQILALRPVHNKQLSGICAKGHDLTLPGAQNINQRCTKCERISDRERRRWRYQNDPEARAKVLASNRAWGTSPEVRARARERYRTDPEYREKVLATNKRSRDRRRTQVAP